MPEISRFFGIIIYMYAGEHAPPHFHAAYGEYEVSIDIDTFNCDGKIPRRALNMIVEWAEIHKNELMENWEALRNDALIKKISPLE